MTSSPRKQRFRPPECPIHRTLTPQDTRHLYPVREVSPCVKPYPSSSCGCCPPRRSKPRSTPACCASPTSRRPRSPSSTPATSGSSPRPAARPSVSARRAAKSRSPGFHRTARRSPSAAITTAIPTSTPCRRWAASRCASPTTRWATGWSIGTRTAAASCSPGRGKAGASASASFTVCRRRAACPRSFLSLTASSERFRRTARRWLTCRRAVTSEPGSVIAAVGRRRSGCSISRTSAHATSRPATPTTVSRCGTVARSTSCPTGVAISGTTSGPTIWTPETFGR